MAVTCTKLDNGRTNLDCGIKVQCNNMNSRGATMLNKVSITLDSLRRKSSIVI